MAVVPALPSITGGTLTTSEQAAIVAAVAFLQTPPTAIVRQTVAQSLSNNTATALTFDTRDRDTAGGWSSGANTRYTAQYAGLYLFNGAGAFAASTSGQRSVNWAVNGTSLNTAGTFLNTTAASGILVPAPGQLIFLNVGDFVQLMATQNSGGVLNTLVAATDQPVMSVLWVSN